MERIHFIGIGGSGLSAIARLLLESGDYAISGSDQLLSPQARSLEAEGARVWSGHDASHITGADLVVRSSAIPDNNPEVLAAHAAGIPVLKRSDFLGRLMTGKTGIAIAGTHGKTTTTAMIAWILDQAGQDPSYIIGGVSHDLGTNAHAGRGAAFVIEADEYDRMFLGLLPDMIVVTNLEHDHPDQFPTPEAYRQAFVEFSSRLKPSGLLLACLDDPLAASLLAELPTSCRALTYGLNPSSDYRACHVETSPNGTSSFEAVFHHAAGENLSLGSIQLAIPGRHNVLNALAALAVADQLGLPAASSAAALSSFTGTGRRFDLLGVAAGVAIIDDYAHHPTQIRATLAAARVRFPGRRIWAVWQPHTYSRTQTLLDDYAVAFTDADVVLVTEVYPAREQNPGFSAQRVVERMVHPHARFISGLDDTARYLLDHLTAGDVLLVLSAGDADRISAQVLESLKAKERRA